MPLSSSWFYKLRRRRSAARGGDEAARLTGKPASHRAPTTRQGEEVPPCPCSPNRASYYVRSGDRRVLPLGAGKGNPKLRDTHFVPRSPQPNDIVFDVVAVGDGRFDGLKAMPELKLRPILTRPVVKKDRDGDGSDSGTSAAASPAARVRRRRRLDVQVPVATVRQQRRRWLYESLVVVKESTDPEEDFLESMAEMIAAMDDAVQSPRGLEELLACYLALNAPEHHHAIVAAFRRVWLVDETNAAKPRSQAHHR